MQIDNTIDETSSPNRKTSDNPIEILENDIETVKNDHNDENVYEIDPVITWETLQNYRETSDCEPFNVITDKFEKINTKPFPRGFWDSKVSHKLYMLILRIKLRMRTIESLYKINQKNFYTNYGGRLLSSKYNNVPSKLIKSLYSEYEWLFWKFVHTPSGLWNNHENQLKYMDWLGEKLGYTTMDDWYQIEQKDFSNNYGGGFLVSKYNHSPYQLLTSLYPDHEWLFWKFTVAPNNSWDSKENQLKYMGWLGEQFRYNTTEDWYKITQNDFQGNYGSGFLKNYNNSPYQLLKCIYPEYEWLFWKFSQAPSGLWKIKENQLKYMNWLGENLGYTTKEDWYKITQNDFHTNYGCGLLSSDSPYRLLKSIYPECEWLFWKFIRAPNNSWDSKENQLKYMGWLGEQLGYTKLDDWYNINHHVFKNNYGGGLISKYNNRPSKLLSSVYPEYEWLFWKFIRAPNEWDNEENQLKYMNWLGEKLGYTTTEDWYEINVYDVYSNYGNGLLSHYYNGSPYQLLSSVYPNFEWDRTKFMKQYSEQQIEWLNFLQKYYGISVQHACNDGEYRIPETRYYADGFCRDTNTIYEYHGDYWHGNPRIFPSNDFNKTTKCTYGELYDNTYKRESEIRGLGYNLVVIWESDWIRINNAIRKLQKQYSLRKNN